MRSRLGLRSLLLASLLPALAACTTPSTQAPSVDAGVGATLGAARTAVAGGDAREAAASYRRFLDEAPQGDPTRADALYELALLRLGADGLERDPNEALEHLRSLVAEHPEHRIAEVTALVGLLEQIESMSSDVVDSATALGRRERALREREAQLATRIDELTEREAALRKVTDQIFEDASGN